MLEVLKFRGKKQNRIKILNLLIDKYDDQKLILSSKIQASNDYTQGKVIEKKQYKKEKKKE